ncbi:MAG: hypothetical protein BWY76_02181 [bacterium ADurb.Bin429]|nr:MAG: hypothetical protein BWY76_02181 [bacterium ADurb.Bin429]
MTQFTLDGPVLQAMLAFTSSSRGFTAHAILQTVLVEVTPESVRLVATDTHTLGLLHLTPILGYHLDITCEEPISLALPIEDFTPVLKDRSLPVTVSLDGARVTITTASGLSLTQQGQPAEEFPQYQRVLALEPSTPTGRLAFDLGLLAKFTTFAKAMKVDPHLDFCLHGPLSPAAIRIAGLAGFFGVLMPRQLAYETAIPDWLPLPQSDESRVIRLRDVEGVAVLTGVDEDGCHWSQFFVDELAEQAPGTCAVCGAAIPVGWMNLDNDGEEVCDRHIQLITDDAVDGSGTCSTTVAPAEDAVAIPA